MKECNIWELKFLSPSHHGGYSRVREWISIPMSLKALLLVSIGNIEFDTSTQRLYAVRFYPCPRFAWRYLERASGVENSSFWFPDSGFESHLRNHYLLDSWEDTTLYMYFAVQDLFFLKLLINLMIQSKLFDHLSEFWGVFWPYEMGRLSILLQRKCRSNVQTNEIFPHSPFSHFFYSD